MNFETESLEQVKSCFVIEAVAAPFQSDHTAQYFNKTVYDWNILNTLRQKPFRNGGKVVGKKDKSDGMTMCNTENTLYSFLNTKIAFITLKLNYAILKYILISIFSV